MSVSRNESPENGAQRRGRFLEEGLHTSVSRDHSRTASNGSAHSDIHPLLLDKEHPVAHKTTPTHRGWRKGLRIAAWATLVILIINLCMTATLLAKHGVGQGTASIYSGDCQTVGKFVAGLHIAINIIGSLLLAASSYAMQCLAAPTREECDRAHARSDWLDIGVPSVRNIFKLRTSRILLWVILAISSIPIHLVYNSTFFRTIGKNDYRVFVVNEAFIKGEPVSFPWINYSAWEDPYQGRAFRPYEYMAAQQEVQHAGLYQNLTIESCLKTYAQNYVADYDTLFMVVKNNSVPHGVVYEAALSPGNGTHPWYWMCMIGYGIYGGESCAETVATKNYDNYTIYKQHPSYCLAKPTPPACLLQYSSLALAIVCVCNTLKMIVMLVLLWKHNTPTLVVVGDAVASYLNTPDSTSKDVGTLDRWTATSRSRALQYVEARYLAFTQRRVINDGERPRRWCTAVSKWQWYWFFFIITGFFGGIGIGIVSAIMYADQSGAIFGEFGAVTPSTVVPIFNTATPYNEDQQVVLIMLLANSPQVILSLFYLASNGIFTVMQLADEWSAYAHKRQYLRVTSPEGQQRSSYWLHFQTKYSIPVLVIFIAMHWLMSETLFMARVKTYSSHPQYYGDLNSSVGIFYQNQTNPAAVSKLNSTTLFYGNLTSEQVNFTSTAAQQGVKTEMGFSVIPMISVASLVAAFGLALLFFAIVRKFKSTMPVAASNSLAIASACHRPLHDTSAATSAIKWGVVDRDEQGEVYAFSSLHVKEVLVGKSWLSRRRGNESNVDKTATTTITHRRFRDTEEEPAV